MQMFRCVLSLAVVLGLGGCAGLEFNSDVDMKGQAVGLKSYYPKPYILVARDGTSKVTSVNVHYLPDLANPVFVKPRSGYGSANLTMAFTNGMISNFGQQTDTKLPGLPELGGFNLALAAAEKARVETSKLERQSADLGKYAEKLRSIAKELRQLVKDDEASTHVFISDEHDMLLLSADQLDGGKTGKYVTGLASDFMAPGASAIEAGLVQNLVAISKAIAGVKAKSEQLSEDAKKIWDKLANLKANLAKIIEELKPRAPEPPALSLYEVIMDGDSTHLKEVSLEGVGK